MPKVTLKDKKPGRSTERVQVTRSRDTKLDEGYLTYEWWKCNKLDERARQVVSSYMYLQKTQQYRIKQASIFNRVLFGKPLMNYALNSKLLDISNQLPIDRPAMNVTYSCVDTLTSRISQNRPQPVFLTDNGDYKERCLADKMNQFIIGEFFRTKAYDIGVKNIKDALNFGDGFVKIVEKDNKVCLERRLTTQLWVDKNDSYEGNPQSLYEGMIMNRDQVKAMFPDKAEMIDKAMKAYVDGSTESTETVTDQIIVVEAWHKRSSEDSEDGKHVIVCSAGELFADEDWDKDDFPFVKLPYDELSVGWYSRGLVEILLGTQIEINKMMITASQSINLMGTPRIFIDEMSRVLETAFNNNIGTIIKVRNLASNAPIIKDGTSGLTQDWYDHLERLVTYAYQQSGISALAATSQKPMGLNSGESIRAYDSLQSDRFAAFAKRYENYYIELAYKVIDLATDIAKRTGKYTTVYPTPDGTREIELPKTKELLKNTNIIQCFDQSSLPRDPAGRYAQLSEMLAAGEIDLREFRRLIGFPDLKQSDKLANALEERIFFILDKIVEEDGYKPQVDPFLLDPTGLAQTLTVQYINRYTPAGLEEKKLEKLRNFFAALNSLQEQAMPQPTPQPQSALPQATPPQSPIAPTSGVQV